MSDDYPDNNSTPGNLWFNFPGLHANFEVAGDVDWFYYPQGQPNAAILLTNAQFQLVRIQVIAPYNNSVMAEYYGPAANAHITVEPGGITTSFYISVQGFTADGAPAAGTYTISAVNVASVDDHGNDATTTSTVTIDGAAATGIIDFSQDKDWFRINGMDGEQVRFTLQSAEFATTLIYARDLYGNVVASYSGSTSNVSFVAPASARYIEIYGFDAAGNWDTGAYSFAITSIPDDHGDTLATATPIILGETVNGVFEPGGDTDWFAITLTAGQPVLFTLPDTVGDVRFYLANGNETEADIPSVRQNGQFTAGFVADATGVYYVRVTGATGPYTLNSAISAYNPHDPANFPVVPENGYLTGSLYDSTDVAWYRVDLAAGETLSLSAAFAFQHLNVAFYDTQGNEVSPAQGQTVRYITANEATTYYIALTAPLGGGYNLQSIVGADDFADGLNAYGSGIEPMGVLTPDGPAVAFSPNHAEDVDVFAISLTAGQSIEIIAPWWLGIGSNAGGILFYDSAGNPVEVDFFHVFTGSTMGDTQSAGMTATTAGTYYVALASGGPSSLTFPVQAITLTSPHPMDVSTFEVLTNGEYVPSGAGNGWFAVNLQVGQTFALDGEGALYDMYGNRIQVQAVVDLTVDWFDYFTVGTTGTYYFQVFAGENGGPNDFTAQIFFDDAPDWSPATPTITHETYPVLNASGDQFNGRIEVYDDEDFFSVALTAGQTVRIRVEFTDLHNMSEEIQVIGPDGQPYIGQLESVNGSEIVFTAPAAGTYYVRVDGLYRYIGDYTVTLAPATPADAYDGQPGIIPAAPAQPAANVTATIVQFGGAYTINAGTVLSSFNLRDPDFFAPYGSPIIYASNSPQFNTTLNNAGLMYSYADTNVGIAVSAVNADRLINSGVIVAENAFSYLGPGQHNQRAVAVYVSGVFSSIGDAVDNSGQIFALSTNGNAMAVTSESQAVVRNSGLIAAHATWSPQDPTQSGAATGVGFGNGGVVINEAGGQIIAQGDSYATAVSTSQWGLTVTNYGLIEAQTQGAYAISHGISAAPTSTTSTAGGVVYNYGTIRADQAIYGAINVYNYAGGVIEGDITLFQVPNGINTSTETIVNQGTITGHVDMSDGDDMFNNAGGVMNGSVDLSFGRDTYVGGDQTDAVVGGHGDDTLVGNGGRDLLLGSYGDDTITGGLGNDGLYGEIGDDRIVTAGGDVASGGVGDDRIETGDYAFASIAGDAGFDTWVLPSGARTLDLALVIASGRVGGIEAIHLAGSQTLVIHPADVTAISGAAALYISGAATDSVYLSGAWSAGAQVVRDGVTYATYVSGGTAVYVQVGVSTATGASPPAGTGLDPVSGGDPALAPGAVAGADLSPATIDSFHRIIDHFVIGPDEVWRSTTGAVVLSALELFGPTLTNYGSIVSYGSTSPHVASPWGLGALGAATGVYALHIDSVENYGSIVARAILGGLATGFIGTAFNGVINGATGIIHAYAEAGLAIAFDGFGSGGWGEWSIHNLGDIYAFSDTGFAIALSEHNGCAILNDGVIEANGGDGAIAVDLSNAGDGVWNRGQIIAYAPLTSTYLSIGIICDGGGRIVNDGLIAAEIALDLVSRYQEDASVTNTGTIVGDIRHRQPSSIALGAAQINNSGDIFGNIYLSESLDPNSITNTGRIEGDIYFGAGADLYDGRSGRLIGVIHAGAGNDTLYAGIGNDSLDGGAGADTMAGGLGDDLYIVDNSGDVTTETLNGGVDTVQSAVTRNLGANLENLVLTGAAAINGFGNALNNTITGNGAANQLNGFDGNDTLDGGAGTDAMFGGNGDDVYIVDNAGDVTSEVSALGGVDTVMSSVSRNLTANIENLTLTGAAALTGAGNSLNNVLIGNAGANVLYGFGGNDSLDGGAGADTLFGAAGDDAYYVDDVGDITVEGIAGAAGGVDTVITSISRNLNANFENMTLVGAATIAYGNVLNNVLTGDGLANSLYGFDGADTLDGGAGADQMFGANGDDTYIVDNAGDVTSEVSALGGTDTVLSSVTRNLTANLENLTLTGNAAIAGAGNTLDNVITGNSAANTLFGLDGADTLDGGLGADTLQGGPGADTYVFSSALGAGNVDTVNAFSVADDTIQLNSAVFTGLAAGALAASAFHIGASAGDADDRIIYDSATGALYFDADGDGAGAAIQFAAVTAGLALSSTDFIVGGP